MKHLAIAMLLIQLLMSAVLLVYIGDSHALWWEVTGILCLFTAAFRLGQYSRD